MITMITTTDMHFRKAFPKVATVSLALLASLVQAQVRSHEHGVATLDVTVHANRITVLMVAPLGDVAGLERSARTAEERAHVSEAMKTLRASSLFGFDPAARCSPDKTEITAPELGLGKRSPHGPPQGHAEVQARFDFICGDARRASFVDVGLFEPFTAMKRIDVQMVTPRGKFTGHMRPPSRRLHVR